MAAKRETVLQAILTADIAEFKKAMTRAGEQAQKVGKQMQDVGKKMSTYLTLPLAAAGGFAIKMASDFEESSNKVQVAFGDAADTVTEFAQNTLKQFGIAEGSALDMAALFGDMATSMGISTGAAADMSTQLVGLAGDLASFKNIRLDVAETALKSIFTGETESLKNLGIVMTQANLQAYALSQGMNGNIQAMSEAEKVQLRYNYVLSKTVNAQGDFERTGGGAANQMRIFQESLKELGQEFGENILPMFTGVIKKVNTMVQFFGSLSERTQNIILVVGGVVAAIGPLLVVFGSVSAALPILISGFTTLGTVLGAIFSPVGLIIAAVGALAAAFIYLRDNSNVVVKHLKNGWTILKNFFVDTIKFILKPLDTFAQGLVNLAQLAGVEMQNPMSKLMGSLDGLKSKVVPVTDEFGSFKDALKNTAVDLGLIKKNADSATTAIENLNNATAKATGTAQIQTQTLDSLSTKTIEAGKATGRAAVMIDHKKWEEHQKNLKAAELSTAALETVTNGTAQSIVSSLSMLAGQSKGWALFEIATNTAVGLAKAVQAGANLPFPSNIPAIAAGSAAVLSGMASAKQVLSSAPAFADGGIVSGSSRYGDRVLARVNSGEMILNSGQQANLFDMINGGGGGQTLTAKIKGSDIWLSNKRSGQERRRFTGR